jgi:protein-tyrosine-phosphatase
MNTPRRRFDLGIWGLAGWYFALYLPYCALVKALAEGTVPGVAGRVPGFVLLPAAALGTAVTMPVIITLLGWWKYAGRRRVLGLNIPWPGRWLALSGLGSALIIACTTLAFTFTGISILLALLMMRGGVLILAPVVDTVQRRRVRWFSWVALGLTLLALGVTFADVGSYDLTAVAVLNIAFYLAGYTLRLPCITRLAKSPGKDAARRYFVEELLAALPLLVLLPALLALVGPGEVGSELRRGFTTFLLDGAAVPALLVGVLYACLYVFGTLIYLDCRENTFCVPLNRCSSVLSGVAAAYVLHLCFGQEAPGVYQLLGTGIVVTAILFLSPLHHFRRQLGRVRRWLSADGLAYGGAQRVFVFVCGGNTARSPMAQALCQAEIARRLKLAPRVAGVPKALALSAGLYVTPGAPLAPEAQSALDSLGVRNVSHAAQALTAEMVERAEIIFCMTREHRREVLERFPAAAPKTHCLGDEEEVEEPKGGGAEAFLSCALRLVRLVNLRLDEAGIVAA